MKERRGKEREGKGGREGGTHILSMSHVRTDLYLLQEGGGGAQTVDLVLVLLPVQSTHLPAKNRAGKSTGSQETFDE